MPSVWRDVHLSAYYDVVVSTHRSPTMLGALRRRAVRGLRLRAHTRVLPADLPSSTTGGRRPGARRRCAALRAGPGDEYLSKRRSPPTASSSVSALDRRGEWTHRDPPAGGSAGDPGRDAVGSSGWRTRGRRARWAALGVRCSVPTVRELQAPRRWPLPSVRTWAPGRARRAWAGVGCTRGR